MKKISINHQPVELYKILKFENLVCGGGEAKVVISSGMVLLNGEVEIQKRKKVVPGDIIGFDGELYKVVLDDKPTKAAKPKASTTAKAEEPKPQIIKPKRSSISF